MVSLAFTRDDAFALLKIPDANKRKITGKNMRENTNKTLFIHLLLNTYGFWFVKGGFNCVLDLKFC